MPNLRCTGRLLKHLRQKPVLDPPAPENRLGDWYANALNIGRNRLVLVTSERSLLCLVTHIRDSAHLRERIRERAFALLYHLGVPPDLAAAEVRGMQGMPFAKTANRSVLGSMNDFAVQAEAYVRYGPAEIDLTDLELRLNTVLCGPLEYLQPMEVTRHLFRRA